MRNIFIASTLFYLISFIFSANAQFDINQKAILGTTSKLSGDLKASIITIEEGAQFDGVCKMIGKDESESNVKKINAINS